MSRYATPDTAQRDLQAAGFTTVDLARIDFDITMPNGADDLIRFLAAGSVRSRALYSAQPPQAQEHIADHLRIRVPPGTNLHLAALVLTATAGTS